MVRRDIENKKEVGLAQYLIHLHIFFVVKIFFERVPETAAERDAAKVVSSLPYRNISLLSVVHRHWRSRLILNFLFYHEKLLRSVDCRYIYRALKIWIRLNLNTRKLEKKDLSGGREIDCCLVFEYVEHFPTR